MQETESYLFHLSQDFMEFRLPELEVICESINQPNCIRNHNYSNQSPLFTCNLPNDDVALNIGDKSFLLKSISKLIVQGDNLDELITNLCSVNYDSDIEGGETFKIDFYSYGKIYTQDEKIEKIEKLVDALKFEQKGLKVCLNDKIVKHKFFYAEEWIETEPGSCDEFDSTEAQKNNAKKYLRKCFLGKFLCNGQSSVVHKYNLKDRGFIGNTSMDPLLSLIMSNMGKVTPSSFVYDPFVGTGSLLIGAAHCGAHVAGADLDYNLVHSRGLSSRMGQKYRKKEENIRNNLKQYGLESKYIDILAADFSTKYIRDNFEFDAIISDPPYGIREKAKKIGKKNKTIDSEIIEEEKSSIFTQHTKYQLGDIFYDLLEFSSKHLVPDGRLVFWLPIYTEVDRTKLSAEEMRKILIEFIPSHEDLMLLGFSEQRLTKFTSRILVTMKKKIYNLEQKFKNLKTTDSSHDNNETKRFNSELLNQFRDKYFSPKIKS